MNVDSAVALAMPLVFGAEGCRLVAYLDTLPLEPVWTIGHGTTQVDGHPVVAGLSCTRQQADAWAAADLRSVAEQVLRCVKVTIDDFQLGALASLAYNIGIGHFEHSSVLEALNLGFFRPAADRILEYDHAGGQVIDGLITRRARERALFLTAMRPVLKLVQPHVQTADDLNQREIDSLDPLPPAAA